MATEREELATRDVGLRRRDDGVIARLSFTEPSTEELLEFVRRPQRVEIDLLLSELIQQLRIPLQPELGDAIVGKRELPRLRVLCEVEISALDNHQRVARVRTTVTGRFRCWALGDLIACDDATGPIGEDGPAGAAIG